MRPLEERKAIAGRARRPWTGRSRRVKVVEIKPKSVVVDGNHLLAGKVVELEVTLISVDSSADANRTQPQFDIGGESQPFPVQRRDGSAPTRMSDVTHILSQIESGDPAAAEQLLPLVYDELRKLAAAKLAQEKPGQTLQATALVHEAYLRLVDVDKAQHWNSRGHFFAAAAEAMRRILVDSAQRKQSAKRGGQVQRVGLTKIESLSPAGAST